MPRRCTDTWCYGCSYWSHQRTVTTGAVHGSPATTGDTPARTEGENSCGSISQLQSSQGWKRQRYDDLALDRHRLIVKKRPLNDFKLDAKRLRSNTASNECPALATGNTHYDSVHDVEPPTGGLCEPDQARNAKMARKSASFVFGAAASDVDLDSSLAISSMIVVQDAPT